MKMIGQCKQAIALGLAFAFMGAMLLGIPASMAYAQDLLLASPKSGSAAVYSNSGCTSKMSTVNSNNCIVCSSAKANTKAASVKVNMPGCSPSTGYIKSKDYSFDKISISGTATTKAYKQIGKPYNKPYNCRELVVYATGNYKDANKTPDLWKKATHISKSQLKAGDLVFYKGGSGSGNTQQPYGHVALALNKSFIIHSTTLHGGNYYPNGGVHISKIGYRNGPSGYAR